MTARILTFTAAGLVGLAGCDSVAGDPGAAEAPPATAEAKLRHWDLEGPDGQALARASGDGDVDFIVTFQGIRTRSYVRDQFCGQGIRTRSYIRDSFDGVAGTVRADSLDQLLDCLVANPDVKFVEPDLPVPAPDENIDYVSIVSNDDDDDDDDDDDLVLQGGVEAGGVFGGSQNFVLDDDDDDDDDRGLLWNLKNIQAQNSSARSGNGSGSVNVDVFVIDTDIDHPEVHVASRRSFLPSGVRPAGTAHGNHVALTIAARDDRRGLVGVAPGARVHALSVFDESGAAPMSRLIEAVDHVMAWKKANPSKPAVVNMSVGSYLGTTAMNALDDAVQSLIDLGVPVVVSAGNHSADASLVSPAHVKDAITVGSYNQARYFSRQFSNYGAVVDLLAPGDQVVSGADRGRYARMSGTSMAAPHVTGAVALYLARNPRADARRAADEVIRKGRDRYGRNLPRGTTTRSVWLENL